MTAVLLRFRDLKDRKIVSNHPTLLRWIDREGFPPGRWLGPNTRAWREDEVEEWISSRPTERPGGAQRPGLDEALRKKGASWTRK